MPICYSWMSTRVLRPLRLSPTKVLIVGLCITTSLDIKSVDRGKAIIDRDGEDRLWRCRQLCGGLSNEILSTSLKLADKFTVRIRWWGKVIPGCTLKIDQCSFAGWQQCGHASWQHPSPIGHIYFLPQPRELWPSMSSHNKSIYLTNSYMTEMALRWPFLGFAWKNGDFLTYREKARDCICLGTHLCPSFFCNVKNPPNPGNEVAHYHTTDNF